MRTIPILFALALLFLLAACSTPGDDRPGTGNETDTGDFSLLLTDAPTDDAEWLRVDFGRIELAPSDETTSEGVVVVSEDAGTIENLLELDNGETHTLATDVEVPDGTYAQIRLIVEDVTIAFPDGDGGVIVRNVKCPSCPESGLKIAVEPELVVEGGESSRIVLDFDAAKAVHLAGKSGTYILKPTAIRAVSVSGTLEGRVESATGEPLENAKVAVYEGERDEGEEPVVSTLTEADGSYRIITLVEGDYTVVVSADGHEATTGEAVVITANETTTFDAVGLVEITTGALEDVVTAADETLIPGATVSVYEGAFEKGEDPVAQAVTGADGRFVIDALAEGDYTVVVAAEGYEAVTFADVSVTADATLGVVEDADVVLAAVEATGTLTGTISSLDGPVPSGTPVQVYEELALVEDPPVGEAFTDSEGNYEIDDLPAGTYTVVVTADGFEEATSFDVVVTADETATLDVELDAVVDEVAPDEAP